MADIQESWKPRDHKLPLQAVVGGRRFSDANGEMIEFHEPVRPAHAIVRNAESEYREPVPHIHFDPRYLQYGKDHIFDPDQPRPERPHVRPAPAEFRARHQTAKDSLSQGIGAYTYYTETHAPRREWNHNVPDGRDIADEWWSKFSSESAPVRGLKVVHKPHRTPARTLEQQEARRGRKHVKGPDIAPGRVSAMDVLRDDAAYVLPSRAQRSSDMAPNFSRALSAGGTVHPERMLAGWEESSTNYAQYMGVGAGHASVSPENRRSRVVDTHLWNDSEDSPLSSAFRDSAQRHDSPNKIKLQRVERSRLSAASGGPSRYPHHGLAHSYQYLPRAQNSSGHSKQRGFIPAQSPESRVGKGLSAQSDSLERMVAGQSAHSHLRPTERALDDDLSHLRLPEDDDFIESRTKSLPRQSQRQSDAYQPYSSHEQHYDNGLPHRSGYPVGAGYSEYAVAAGLHERAPLNSSVRTHVLSADPQHSRRGSMPLGRGGYSIPQGQPVPQRRGVAMVASEHGPQFSSYDSTLPGASQSFHSYVRQKGRDGDGNGSLPQQQQQQRVQQRVEEDRRESSYNPRTRDQRAHKWRQQQEQQQQQQLQLQQQQQEQEQEQEQLQEELVSRGSRAYAPHAHSAPVAATRHSRRSPQSVLPLVDINRSVRDKWVADMQRLSLRPDIPVGPSDEPNNTKQPKPTSVDTRF